MIIIRINRRLWEIAILAVLTGCIVFNIVCYFQNAELSKKNETLVHLGSWVNKTGMLSFGPSASVNTNEYRYIEIFDIKKGEVIKRVATNPVIQKEVVNYLNGITGMYIKAKAIPDSGRIIRVPLEPSVVVKNKWLNDYGINTVDEVFILFPEQGKPYLLVLDSKKRPLFYNFDGDTSVLPD